MSSPSSPPGPPEPETITIGCDHAGHGLKRDILKFLHELKVPCVDIGCASPDESVHYPLYGKKVVEALLARPRSPGYTYLRDRHRHEHHGQPVSRHPSRPLSRHL